VSPAEKLSRGYHIAEYSTAEIGASTAAPAPTSSAAAVCTPPDAAAKAGTKRAANRDLSDAIDAPDSLKKPRGAAGRHLESSSDPAPDDGALAEDGAEQYLECHEGELAAWARDCQPPAAKIYAFYFLCVQAHQTSTTESHSAAQPSCLCMASVVQQAQARRRNFQAL
jgi:hypothetical protein